MSYSKLHNSGPKPIVVGAELNGKPVRVEIPAAGFAVVMKSVALAVQLSNPGVEVSPASKEEYLRHRAKKDAQEKARKKAAEENVKIEEANAKIAAKDLVAQQKKRADDAKKKEEADAAHLEGLKQKELAVINAVQKEAKKAELEEAARIQGIVEMAVEAVLDRLDLVPKKVDKKGKKI